jgi:hypothetical protein
LTRKRRKLNEQFVEKQHTMVSERNFAGPWRRSAAHERDRAGAVVR